jgi:hypothetical protein
MHGVAGHEVVCTGNVWLVSAPSAEDCRCQSGKDIHARQTSAAEGGVQLCMCC